MDGIPILSQAKSLIQILCNQKERAKETQNNFWRQCPVFSQARSVVEFANGDVEAALETQGSCLRFVGGFVNGIPVVGHAKGVVHYVFGDSDGGASAMNAAWHSTAVMGGGAGGFLVGGPAGAVAAGIAAGAVMDGTISIVDTAIRGKVDGKPRLYGTLEPLSDPKDVGKWVDWTCGLGLDVLAARSAGTMAGEMRMGKRNGGITSFADVDESSSSSSDSGFGTSTKATKGSSKSSQAAFRPSASEKKSFSTSSRAGFRSSTNAEEEDGESPDSELNSSFDSEKSSNESSGGSAPIDEVESVSVSTTWPARVFVSPNMIVLMMVRNKCFYFFVEKAKGKFELLILHDLLNDVGPMVVEKLGRTLGIWWRNLKMFFQDASSEEHELEEDQVYTLGPEGFVEKILDFMEHFSSNGNGGVWKSQKRVAVLRYFIRLVITN